MCKANSILKQLNSLKNVNDVVMLALANIAVSGDEPYIHVSLLGNTGIAECECSDSMLVEGGVDVDFVNDELLCINW